MIDRRGWTAVLAVTVAVSLTPPLAAQQTWHVDGSVGASGDGMQWATAFQTIQEALDEAEALDEIWVSAGVYTPQVESSPGVPQSVTYQLKANVRIYGGFLGETTEDPDGEGELSDRCIFAPGTETILSGDLNGDDDPLDPDTLTDNAYHVVTASGENAEFARLDGFTIRGGNAVDTGLASNASFGAGLLVEDAEDANALVIANCAFEGNTAGIYQDESPTAFLDGHGAAIALTGGQPGPTIPVQVLNCVFRHNEAIGGFGQSGVSAQGGAISNQAGIRLNIVNSLFHDNRAVDHVGDNSRGGAIHNAGELDVFNCTIADNTATSSGGQGGGLGGAIYNAADGDVEVKNSILWGNLGGNPERGQQPDQIRSHPEAEQTTVEYTDVELDVGQEEPFPGTGNIALDPLFVDPSGGDYRLDLVQDVVSSPCQNAGSTAFVPTDAADVDGDDDDMENAPDRDWNERNIPVESPCGVDMGAYERGDPDCPADFNVNGATGYTDLYIVLIEWGPCPAPEDGGCAADLTCDGGVGNADLNILLATWGPCPGPVEPCLGGAGGGGEQASSAPEVMEFNWEPVLLLLAQGEITAEELVLIASVVNAQ